MSGRTALTFGGRPFLRPARIGVRGYRPDGRRSFQLLRGQSIADVDVAGRFVYATGPSGVAVIGVRSGSVVSRSPTRFRGNLLGDPARGRDR